MRIHVHWKGTIIVIDQASWRSYIDMGSSANGVNVLLVGLSTLRGIKGGGGGGFGFYK